MFSLQCCGEFIIIDYVGLAQRDCGVQRQCYIKRSKHQFEFKLMLVVRFTHFAPLRCLDVGNQP